MSQKVFSHKLMENNIERDDLSKLKNFLTSPKILTQSINLNTHLRKLRFLSM